MLRGTSIFVINLAQSRADPDVKNNLGQYLGVGSVRHPLRSTPQQEAPARGPPGSPAIAACCLPLTYRKSEGGLEH